MPPDIDPHIRSMFETAVKRSRSLPEQPPEILLEFYGLYKQAHEGDITIKKPGPLDLRGQYKYDAWAARQGISKEEAMKAYIALINKLDTV